MCLLFVTRSVRIRHSAGQHHCHIAYTHRTHTHTHPPSLSRSFISRSLTIPILGFVYTKEVISRMAVGYYVTDNGLVPAPIVESSKQTKHMHTILTQTHTHKCMHDQHMWCHSHLTHIVLIVWDAPAGQMYSSGRGKCTCTCIC